MSIQTNADESILLAIAERDSAFVHDLAAKSCQRLPVEVGQLQAGWLLEDGDEICLQSAGAAALAHANALRRFRRSPGSGLFEPTGEPRDLPPGLAGGSLDRRTGRLLLPRPRRGGRGGFLEVDLSGEQPHRDLPGEPCSLVACSQVGGLLATCMTSSVQLRHGTDDPATVHLHTDSSGTNDLCFSPDGLHLAAISKSGAVWLFATDSGQLVWRGQVPAIGWSVTFTPDGQYLLTGDSDGVVRHWLVDPDQQRQLAQAKLHDWTWDEEDERILRENGIEPARRP